MTDVCATVAEITGVESKEERRENRALWSPCVNYWPFELAQLDIEFFFFFEILTEGNNIIHQNVKCSLIFLFHIF